MCVLFLLYHECQPFCHLPCLTLLLPLFVFQMTYKYNQVPLSSATSANLPNSFLPLCPLRPHPLAWSHRTERAKHFFVSLNSHINYIYDRRMALYHRNGWCVGLSVRPGVRLRAKEKENRRLNELYIGAQGKKKATKSNRIRTIVKLSLKVIPAV